MRIALKPNSGDITSSKLTVPISLLPESVLVGVKRTQSLGNARDLPSNVVVVVGAENSHSLRRNNLVANSDIIVGVNMTEISTYTDVPDNKPAIANDAANTCE